MVSSSRRDDILDADAFGLGAVIQQDAVAQDRIGQRLDVLDRDVRAALQQRARLGAQHEELAGPRAGAPADPVVDEVRRRRPGAAARRRPVERRSATISSAMGTWRTNAWKRSTSSPVNSGSIGAGAAAVVRRTTATSSSSGR